MGKTLTTFITQNLVTILSGLNFVLLAFILGFIVEVYKGQNDIRSKVYTMTPRVDRVIKDNDDLTTRVTTVENEVSNIKSDLLMLKIFGIKPEETKLPKTNK